MEKNYFHLILTFFSKSIAKEAFCLSDEQQCVPLENFTPIYNKAIENITVYYLKTWMGHIEIVEYNKENSLKKGFRFGKCHCLSLPVNTSPALGEFFLFGRFVDIDSGISEPAVWGLEVRLGKLGVCILLKRLLRNDRK